MAIVDDLRTVPIIDQINADLAASGLTSGDLNTRPLDMPERAACNVSASTEGYVIPYYNMTGKRLPFYRIKMFNRDVKYLQLKDTSNHVYFPPNFFTNLQKHIDKENAKPKAERQRYIILTEGEKKAALATKLGFPAVAFGGVDSWRNRILLLPKGTTFSAYSYNKSLIGAKLPSGASTDNQGGSLEPVAIGFEDLANFLTKNNLTAIIIFDSDDQNATGVLKLEVQRAASELGFELRRRGLPIVRIRQLVLPNLESLTNAQQKTGLDDFLLAPDGIQLFQRYLDQILSKRSAFPKHPSIEDDINKKLQSTKLGRKDIQRLSMQLITDLDSRGVRMYSEHEHQSYYFSEESHELIKVNLAHGMEVMQSTDFSKLLYRYYGIATNSDKRLMAWVATQFGAEEPIEKVNPYRVIARPNSPDEDIIRYQLNNGQYAKISGDSKAPLIILDNGAENTLFEADLVNPIDSLELQKEFALRQSEPLEMWWEDVLHEVRLKNHGQTATIFSLLYYLSPWLHRWRGSQLPVELVIGEAGSGKSTLCELRLSILTGQPKLRNAPTDIKDWHASIVNTGGLHVTDNVQLLDKVLKQRLSDEICRLITEPDPQIEMRKLYTNAELVRINVDPIFVVTSVTQAFNAADLLQRSVILELDKMAKNPSIKEQTQKQDQSQDDAEELELLDAEILEDEKTKAAEGVTYDSSWKNKQLNRFGGRTAWVSHHLYVLHKFFEAVQTKWNPNYKARHRLINLEQSLCILAELFGLEYDWIPGYLSSHIEEAVVEADWVLEGLKEFVTQATYNKHRDAIRGWAAGFTQDLKLAQDQIFSANSLSAWACQQERFMECGYLTNARRLGRYMQINKALIASAVGITEGNKINNRITYLVRIPPKDPKKMG